MKWITRRKAHVDRTSCPWLIRKFIDPEPSLSLSPVIPIQQAWMVTPLICVALSTATRVNTVPFR